MNSELGAIEERIRRLEKFVIGQNLDRREDDEKLIDTLMVASRKLASVVSRNEKVSSALKRVDEVQKYADPLYAESEIFVSEAVQLQLVMSKEKELKEAFDNFQNFQMLKTVLDSQAIQDVPKLDGSLSKIAIHQDCQEKEVSQLMENTYILINNYSNFINDISLKLAEIEKSVSKKDIPKEQKTNY